MQDGNNPYDAPRSMLYGTAKVRKPRLETESAGKWRRFFNWTVDAFAYYFLSMMIGAVAVMLGGRSALVWLQGLGFFEQYALGLLILMAYYIPMETAFGFTLGKLVTGTRVVNENGEGPNLVQILLRTFCRFIPFEPFSVLFTADGRGWHDSLSGTYVVRKD
jgi:uncharacterized RDD family membrane protein YckC